MTEEHFSELDRVGQHAEKRLGSSTTAAAASVGMAIPESHIVRKIALLNRETREITSLESCRAYKPCQFARELKVRIACARARSAFC